MQNNLLSRRQNTKLLTDRPSRPEGRHPTTFRAVASIAPQRLLADKGDPIDKRRLASLQCSVFSTKMVANYLRVQCLHKYWCLRNHGRPSLSIQKQKVNGFRLTEKLSDRQAGFFWQFVCSVSTRRRQLAELSRSIYSLKCEKPNPILPFPQINNVILDQAITGDGKSLKQLS